MTPDEEQELTRRRLDVIVNRPKKLGYGERLAVFAIHRLTRVIGWAARKIDEL